MGFGGCRGMATKQGCMWVQHGASTPATPHTALHLHLGSPCVMLACTLQASKAPTPKPLDALSCPQHALPMHALHGVCTPGRGNRPEITGHDFHIPHVEANGVGIK